MSKTVKVVLLFAAVALVAWLRPGHAEDFTTPRAAVAEGKRLSRLPPWLNASDTWRIARSAGRYYSCLTDAQTGARWTTWGSAQMVNYFVITGNVRYGPGVDTTYADERVCWPDLTPQALSLGEPAYLNVFRSTAGAVDWARMNQSANIAGTTTQGEACSSPTSAGFYLLPRLNTDGRTPFTRCE